MTRPRPAIVSRRQAIGSLMSGSLLLPGVVAELLAGDATPGTAIDPLAPKAPPFPGKAKRVIFLFMSGGVSHLETFDPKPRLAADAGKLHKGRTLLAPQFRFTPAGSSGTPVSELFPEMAKVVADNPFAEEPGDRVVAIFLDEPPPKSALTEHKNLNDERIALGKREIYVHYPGGQGTSRLIIPAAKAGTARNMNTVATLARMATDP